MQNYIGFFLRLHLFSVLFFGTSYLNAQSKPVSVIIKNQSETFKGIPKKTRNIKDLQVALDKIKTAYKKQGYLAFSVDSIVIDSVFNLYLFKGELYEISQLTCSPKEFEEFLPQPLNRPVFNPEWVAATEKKFITQLNELGFIFDTIEKITSFNGTHATVHFEIKNHKKVYFDSIHVTGEKYVDVNFLARKTSIIYQKPYQPSKINNLKATINQLGFLVFDSLTTSLNDSLVRVTLFIHPQKNNQISGLIGMQSNSRNKLEFTGNADLQLTNSLKKGESFTFSWKQPTTGSQNLELDALLPFVLKSPLGIRGNLTFEKFDSTFSNTNLSPGFVIDLTETGSLSFLYKWSNSTVSSNSFENYTPSESHLYGFNFLFQKFNHPYFPSKGYLIGMEVLAGNQANYKGTIKAEESFFSEIQFKSTLILPLPIGSFVLKNETKLLVNDTLPTNKYYRLGGFKSFEGVSEQSIICRHLSYFSTLYQLPFNETSQVQLFYQIGWFNELQSTTTALVNRQSVGVGLHLETPAGRLYLSFVLAKKEKEPLRFDQGKLHIGYATRF